MANILDNLVSTRWAGRVKSDATTVWQNNQGGARRVEREVHLPETMRHNSIFVCVSSTPTSFSSRKTDTLSQFLCFNQSSGS